MGRFDDRATRPARGPRDILRWKLLGRRSRAAAFTTPRRAPDEALIASPEPSLTWIGHASFVLRLGGRLIATDPLWSERIQGLIPRQSPPGIPLERVPPIDVVTISHAHYDHLDLPTLRRIGPGAHYLVPLGVGRHLAEFPRVTELDWWQTADLGGLAVTLVPARHWSMRSPFDRNEALWGGFVFDDGRTVAYHAGDTALTEDFAEIGRRHSIDYAMLPIGAYEPRWFMEPQHMNPDDAGAALLALGARTLVAMHWGTFRLTDEPLGEPPERMRAWWAARGLAPERLWIFDLGETRRL